MFVSFEGIDGSGKSTQLVFLKDWLEEMGRTVMTVREPGATVLSEAIREILLNNRHSIISSRPLSVPLWKGARSCYATGSWTAPRPIRAMADVSTSTRSMPVTSLLLKESCQS
jgi:hypothetical protein